MAFLIGIAIGSFLGVVIDRAKSQEPRAKLPLGRSRCDSCKKQLKWRENIPLISFVFLKGKCRNCRSPIPYWLPLIELVAGFAGIWIAHWAIQTITVITFITIIKIIAAALIAAALIWVFFSDLVYGVIPDLAVGIGAIGVIIMSLMGHMSLMSLMAQLGAAIAAAGFFLFLVLITRGRGMGTGDVTLAGLLGLWLGWPNILLAVWLAFILGSLIGLVLIGLKLKKFGQTIPFGPFLITGAVISTIAGPKLLSIIGL